MSTILVRLKPYNKKRGTVLRRYMHSNGVRFDEKKGWYRVSKALADELAKVHSDYYDPDSPLAFDIMSQKQAIALEEKERKAAEEKALAASPHAVASAPKVITRDAGALTTEDLAGNVDVDGGGEDTAPADEAPALRAGARAGRNPRK